MGRGKSKGSSKAKQVPITQMARPLIKVNTPDCLQADRVPPVPRGQRGADLLPRGLAVGPQHRPGLPRDPRYDLVQQEGLPADHRRHQGQVIRVLPRQGEAE